MELTVIIEETPERFRCYADQVIPNFIRMMHEYVEQITPIMKSYKKLFEKNRTGEFSDRIDELTAKCMSTKIMILSDHVTDNINITPYDTVPTKFDYFITGGKISFIMKTQKKIVLHTVFTDIYGSAIRHKFELRPYNGKWLIDWFGYGYDERGTYKKCDF